MRSLLLASIAFSFITFGSTATLADDAAKPIKIMKVPGNPNWHGVTGHFEEYADFKMGKYDETTNKVTLQFVITREIDVIAAMAFLFPGNYLFNFYDEDNEVLKSVKAEFVSLAGKGEIATVILELPGKKTMEKTKKIILK